MTELSILWPKWIIIKNSGKPRNESVKKLEAEIHEAQALINADPYDFDAYWLKKESDSAASVKGGITKKEEVKPEPQGSFNLEEAKKIIGPNDCAIIDGCAKIAEARMVYMGYAVEKVNPANKSNLARRGQSMNWTKYEFDKKKDEKKQ